MSQIAHNRFPCVTLLGGLSVNLNHLKKYNNKQLNLLLIKIAIIKHVIIYIE